MKKVKKVLIIMDPYGNTVKAYFIEDLDPKLADALLDANKVEGFFADEGDIE